MAFYDLKRGLLLGLWLAVAACEDTAPADTDEASPDARKDAGKDAGKDASRDAGKDAGKDAGRDAGNEPSDDDASTVDSRDAGGVAADAGATACTPFVMPAGVDCSPPADGVLPKDLRCTGLYGKFEQRELACGVIEYKPAYQLWSDAAEKRRFVSLPAGKKIDASDPDAFVFPVGTLFWKEFRVKASAGAERMAETRLLKKTEDGWLYSSYVWSEDETGAIQMNNTTGVPNLYGTGHTVPTRDQCNECHIGRSDAILGWDALLLGPGAEGMTREMLADLDLLEPGAKLDLVIPGNDVERAALGYLHTNCGVSCHNELTTSKARETGMYLRLEKGELDSVAATDAFRSSMNKVPSANAKLGGLPTITGSWVGIRPGDPVRSLIIARQKLRGPEGQMPRIGTNKVDETGVKLTTDWIKAMTPAGGYPAPVP